jgi:hypothetical protein
VRKGLVIEKGDCWNHLGEEMNVVRRVEGYKEEWYKLGGKNRKGRMGNQNRLKMLLNK